MIQAGETFENARTGTRLEVRESTPKRVVFDRRYPPNSGRADPHVHFDITQSWEVLSGEARVVVDGETRDVKGGEVVEIATRIPHQDIHNPFEKELAVRWTVAPVNDFVEAFADSYTHLLTHDKLNAQDEFTPLQIFPILRGTRAQSWLTSIPIPLQKVVIPVGAWLGRLRGYRARYDET
ncbi:MAG: cupin domain-containing protein [Actinomycetota bacterium]|nr:cupin domain-containing protein [Actinomycetota bacterium]